MILICCILQISMWLFVLWLFLTLVFKQKILPFFYVENKAGNVLWYDFCWLFWQTHIPIHQKLLSLSLIETNEKSIMLFSIRKYVAKISVCNVILILALYFSHADWISYFFPLITPTPPAVFSSVKPREVLMCFTAMTWSTSCNITTLLWPWWLRTSQPTWRQWGSSPKVCYHNQK